MTGLSMFAICVTGKFVLRRLPLNHKIRRENDDL